MILDTLANETRWRVEQEKKKIPIETMIALAKEKKEEKKMLFPFEAALCAKNINFICEIKRASPSKGMIAPDFPYVQIAKEYEEAGAVCISVLTEPKYFLGSDVYFTQIRKEVSIPMIRKDFTIDEYQIYQAKVMGADCILLICSLLTEEILSHYLKICDQLQISALVETHDETEIKTAIRVGARIIGVNNRDLKTFEVDIKNSQRLRALVPDSILFVAESGIKTSADIEVLRRANVNGVLIGETLMKSKDKKKMLRELVGELVDKD